MNETSKATKKQIEASPKNLTFIGGIPFILPTPFKIDSNQLEGIRDKLITPAVQVVAARQ